ncbi:Eukaryotic translation initiation factor 4G1, eIF4E-binding domain-containing protein [Penicillium ucsense]|uniref:Eukaryotic translation initiation factor 4G1, eIF4E-binding domain-containing protein n=1 Tax=Penicillium ucsense TaxID=2839758 RepID=A0A8J8WIG1_9EURO|nr:Eukaryotic translation initiation factor 4G1, eIF4E-binding domain-containing protein [Penicillium ucsense]KAF7731313.1 Eukaryotic translation initiation factor 4G1, eIF4E-binding domain-containing protein [Penicillium ucsense]
MTSNPPQSGVQSGQSTATSATTSAPAPATAPAAQSYANATKKSTTDSSFTPVTVGGSTQHGKSSSVSPVNGKPMQNQSTPQQAQSGVTIVNGAPAAAAANAQNDHSRKPSVTITSAGASGYIPNGGAASRPNSLQFGFANQQSSPNMGNPAVLASSQPQSGLGAPATNPRVTSPQTSPSPIPQPASSGGRPPSTYQAQGNVPNFGSFGENAGDNNAPLGPGQQHVRRESSQSTHSDMSAHMSGAPGRGGYPPQGGRGRGYSQSGYQGGQMPYSPGPSFRQTPNQPRGGPNMGPQFHGPNQGRPMPPFPNSPHQANRSPALANAHPTTPQMNQVPMAHPQMPPQPYPGYGQHMGPQSVRFPPTTQLPPRPPRPDDHGFRGGGFNSRGSRRRVEDLPSWRNTQVTTQENAAALTMSMPNLAPESGQFEQYLTMLRDQGFPPYDPNYYNYPGYNMQNMQYMTPPSPQPRPGMPFNPQAPYMQAQYPVQPPPQSTPLSRTPSQMSTERPGSSLGHAATAGSAGAAHAHTGSRSANSPAPVKPHFVIPSAKRSPIIIKDPNSGSVKTFDKNPASPARATPSPVKVATPVATPPPRTASASDHSRTESKAGNAQTDEEKKQALKDAVRQKILDDEAAQKRKEEEASRKSVEAAKPAVAEPAEVKAAEKPAEKPAAETKSEEQKTEDAVESARAAVEDLSLKEKAAPAEEPKTEAVSAPAAPADDEDEIDYDAIEREMAEIEAKERAAEEEYKRKKQAQKEEAERKEREEREQYEINMKKAEREAEEREAAKEAARAKGDNTEDEANRKEREDLFASLKKGGFSATETSTPADSGVVTPVSSDMGPPAKPASAAGKKAAGLKIDTQKETPQPSAAMNSLQNAKFLEDLSQVTYPASVKAPDASLNANSPAGRRFHYDREFLLQFQAIYKDKISVDWDARIRDTIGDSESSSRPQSARTPSMGGRNPSHKGGLGGFPAMMGSFAQTSRPGVSSVNSSMGNRNASAFGSMGRPGMPGMTGSFRNNSSPMPPRVPSSKGGPGSKRGKGGKKEEDTNKAMPLTAGMELKALQQSATGWKPRSLVAPNAGPAPGGEGHMAPDVVQRKVKAALNKMTPEKFDRISSQILDIVSQSKDESDGRTLRQVIQLTFEKATDEAHWAPMYAKFCKSMLESMSPEIKDENIRDKFGNIVTGGSLFRKYLLNRCQEEFERGWKVNLPPKPEGSTQDDVAMLSDEYYIAAAAKRRGLGLVKFIGELYKLGMLTERIMHECTKRLLDFEGVPEEAEVESLCNLLRTIGASLDASEKGPAMMDAYFARINLMMEMPGLPSRLKFMLMDIVDLRSQRWKSKDADKGPKTIQQIREEAARAQAEAEQERQRQQANRGGGGGRPAMGRGDARGFGYGNQAPPPDFASSKVGSDDLRRLRATRNTNQPMSFGPSSLLGSRSSSGRKGLGPGGNLVRGSDDSAASSRTGTPPAGKKEDKEAASSINAFSALASLEDRDNMATSPPSNPTSPMLTKSQPASSERRPSKTPTEGENAA